MAGDSLELNLDDPWLSPFTLRSKPDIPHDGMKGLVSCVLREARIVEPVRHLNSLSDHLHLGVGKRPHVMAQKINISSGGSRLIGIQKLLNGRGTSSSEPAANIRSLRIH
jgi:hypothetical protein